MTLCVSVLAADGAILAADSKKTPVKKRREGTNDAQKLFCVNERCGLVIAGRATFDNRKIQIGDLVSKFSKNIDMGKLDIYEVSRELDNFLKQELLYIPNTEKQTSLIVAGYDKNKNYASYKVHVVNGLEPSKNMQGSYKPGAEFIGRRKTTRSIINVASGNIEESRIDADKILQSIPGQHLAKLSDLVNLIARGQINPDEATEFSKLIIEAVSMIDDTVEEPIDIAKITPKDGFEWLEKSPNKNYV